MIEGFGDDLLYGFYFGVVLFITLLCSIKWALRGFNILSLFRARNDEVQTDLPQPPPVYNPNCCPICLGQQTLALETNCGHLYCGGCLLRHYMEGRARDISSDFLCALCRQRIVLIFNCLSYEEREGILEEQVLQTRDEILNFTTTYNRHISNDLRIMDRVSELPVLLRHFLDDTLHGGLMDTNYLRLKLLLFILGTVMYVLIPFDMFPEMIFGFIGYTEDAVVFVTMFIYVIIIYRNFIANSSAEDEE